MDYSELFSDFLNNCQGRGLSLHTRRAYACDLSSFESWIRREKITYVDKTVLGNWLSGMQSLKLAPATIRRRIACLKAAFRWLGEEGLVENDPFHKFHAPVRLPKRLPKSLSCSEMKTIFKQASAEATESKDTSKQTLWLALEILFATGIRVAELCDIRLCDVDLETGIILIHGKGNRERLVYLVDAPACALLRKYLKSRTKGAAKTEKLLITRRHTQASPDFIRRNLHQLVRRAGITRRVTPHMIRHSTATHLLEVGVDIRYVQKLLGHSSISTTEIYTHVSNASLHATLKKANPRRLLNA